MSQLVDNNLTHQSQERWFDEFVARLRLDQLQLETDTASAEKQAFYDLVFTGNADQLAKLAKVNSQQYFVSKIIIDYLKLINSSLGSKLSFDYNDSAVLVWAVVEDDREDLERELFMAEAKINAKYHDYGYTVNTTIVEESDEYPAPNHYLAVN